VRDFTVAFPALSFFAQRFEIRIDGLHTVVGKYFLMATYAILFYHTLSGLKDHNYLWFSPHSKNGGMSHTIFGFKIIFVQLVVMRYMTVVAMSIFTV
jgi:hypothetical protein